MEIAPMTKRDKILLYVVSMFAFIVLFVRFLLIPGIENHQQAAADLTEAQDAQIAMAGYHPEGRVQRQHQKHQLGRAAIRQCPVLQHPDQRRAGHAGDRPGTEPQLAADLLEHRPSPPPRI